MPPVPFPVALISRKGLNERYCAWQRGLIQHRSHGHSLFKKDGANFNSGILEPKGIKMSKTWQCFSLPKLMLTDVDFNSSCLSRYAFSSLTLRGASHLVRELLPENHNTFYYASAWEKASVCSEASGWHFLDALLLCFHGIHSLLARLQNCWKANDRFFASRSFGFFSA